MADHVNTDENKDTSGDIADENVLSLSDTIRQVKSRQADQSDVVVDMKEAELARIELLGEALESVASEVPSGHDQFEFAVSKGEPPRYWVDMTTFVAMGSDKRTYRLLKDTRHGRTVLAESGDKSDIAKHITEYVAEQVLEKQKLFEGERLSAKAIAAREAEIAADIEKSKQMSKRKPSRMLWFMLGLIVGVGALLAYAWFNVPNAL